MITSTKQTNDKEPKMFNNEIAIKMLSSIGRLKEGYSTEGDYRARHGLHEVQMTYVYWIDDWGIELLEIKVYDTGELLTVRNGPVDQVLSELKNLFRE